jgi:hypothetical protein
MRKLLDNTLSVGLGIIIGGLAGCAFSLWLLKSDIMIADEAYKAGKRDATQECIQLIKQAK